MTFAGYLRVSTDKQTTENQEPDVRRLVDAREGAGKFDDAKTRMVGIFRENESAAKQRPQFDAMMEAARLGHFRRLYIWRLDRFGRSMYGNMRDVRELVERWNVTIISVHEAWLEQTGDPMLKKLILGIFSWAAEHEHQKIKDRTRAGLERARREGKALGRKRVGATIPDRAIAKAAELRQAPGEARGWREVARELRRLGFGDWNHATLARECTKRVPSVRRGKPGWRRGS